MTLDPLEPPRAEPDYEAQDDLAEWGVANPIQLPPPATQGDKA